MLLLLMMLLLLLKVLVAELPVGWAVLAKSVVPLILLYPGGGSQRGVIRMQTVKCVLLGALMPVDYVP